jgi:hypothetical protein
MLVAVIVVALVALAIFGILGFAMLGGMNSTQKKAEANADQILDEAFDGRNDVTFTINAVSVKYETVLAGAKQRGYKLVHQADNQYGPSKLVFERTQPSS